MTNHHSIPSGLFGFGGTLAGKNGLETSTQETASNPASQNRHALLTAQILKGLREISTEIPKSITAQLRSVSEALDERAFCQGLLAVGQALVSDGKLEQAALVYNSLQGIIPSTSSGQAPEHLGELKAEANNRLAALSNRGDLAYQAPVILQQLRAGLTDEVGLGGMVAAQLTFGVSRLKIFNLLERVWRASRVERLAVASGAAFGLEGAALVGAGEGLGYALGHEPVEGDLTLRQKFGHAYLMMGSLRSTSSLIGAMVGRHTLAAASPLARIGQIVAPQVGMFGAIAFTHAVAPSLDLGITPENLGLASLFTLLHFNLAGLALHAIPGYGALNQKIRVETELAIRGAGQRLYNHLAETFQPPQGPLGSQALVPIQTGTAPAEPIPTRISEPGPQIFPICGTPKWARFPIFNDPIFKDPASAITQKSLIREYRKEGPLIVAQEGKNVLIAIPQRRKIQLRNGPATPIYYFLNDGFIGGRILQLNAQSKEWGVADAGLVVSSVQAVLNMGLQKQDLSRLIAFHELWQAHKLGWTYRVDVNINHNLLNATAQPFWGGEPMFVPGAVVQRKFHGETPPKAYRLPLNGPSSFEGLDSGILSFDLGLPYQIGGHPNPRLFEKRSAPEPLRVLGNPLTFRHELLLTDFSAMANAAEGAEFPIAQRHAAPIIAQLVERRSVNEPNHLFPASPQVLVFVLKEGESRGGISLLIEPESINCLAFTTFAVGNGTPMLTGAADIVMEWLATQTAIQRKSLKLFNVYDWNVLAALFRQNLLDPENHVIESYAGLEKTAETVGAFGRDKLSAAYELQRSGKIKFWNVRGRPNSFLIPRELKPKS